MINREIYNIDKLIKIYKNKKIFLITGKSTISFLEKQKFRNKLNQFNFIKYYFKKESVPQVKELRKILIESKKFNPEVIIGLGGGTVIDYSKLCRFFLSEDKVTFNIQKIKKKKHSLRQLICIPTTCGSGAESTTFSVLYKNDKKFSLNNNLMMPNFYCRIPKYLKFMTKKIATPSALDSLAQTLESIMSLNSNKRSLVYSYRALSILHRNIFNYIKTRDYKSTSNMSIAANFAGKAINISKTTGPHALSYVFTSKYGIPHGRAVFMSLRLFLKINYLGIKNHKTLQKKFKKIFSILRINKFEDLENKLKKLEKSYKINIKLIRRDIKKNPNFFTKSVNLERLKNNPIQIDQKMLKKIVMSI